MWTVMHKSLQIQGLRIKQKHAERKRIKQSTKNGRNEIMLWKKKTKIDFICCEV